MKKANVLFDIVVITISLFFFSKTFSFPEGIGQGGIGPAFFPKIILVTIIFFCLIDILKVILLNKVQEEGRHFFEGITRHHAISFCVVVGSMILMIFFLGKLPFILISIIMLFIQFIVLKLKVLTSLVTAVILSISVYLIFVKGFSVLL
ncbi:hypothetical protein HNQ94_003071 [Salirhabdus euzebyi]|uniref:DUF1468 domain-containing protein n=1 Tax=Salirhabdus euzebyi TaxID=394506 RepID=A0A841Q8H6_9BACI|nr:tripartite tricarboxylate transporter TctB family protein [Salirhabdus euzebyi]MBB6454582.1 hypothetical protein [Salirhabdus euzebyi]